MLRFSESLNMRTLCASNLVTSLIESTNELWDMKMPAQFVCYFSLGNS